MDYFNNFLMSTNKYLCGKESEIKIDKDYFEKIDERIEKILNNEETDIKKILTECLNIACIVFYLKPFKDGNLRTAIVFLEYLLSYNGIDFDDERALSDINNNILHLPVFKDINDCVDEETVKLFNEYIVSYVPTRL